MKRDLTLVATWALVAGTGTALANTEPPAAYDARSVGMGSTGVAHVENGASLYHNPALLDGVARGAVTGAFSPLAPQVRAPLAGPGSEVKSTRSVGPLFLLGGAYRIHERFTVGLAAYPTMGFGARFEDAAAFGNLDLAAQLSVIEIAPGAAVKVTDWLALGLAYRVSRFGYQADQPTAPAGAFVNAHAELSDWNFTGLHAGVLARPTDTTRVGLSYRSKITADLEGTTTVGGQDLDTSMEFAVPHIFVIGVAQGLLDDQLLLALDLRYALFKDANKELVAVTTIPGLGDQETTTELDWVDSVGVRLGAEYRLAPEGGRVRAGYSVARSATPGERAMPVMPPPGLHHSVHLGVGYSTSSLDVDLGGYYLFGGGHAEPITEPPMPEGSLDGDYRFNAVLGSLSVTYRFGAGQGGGGRDLEAPRG